MKFYTKCIVFLTFLSIFDASYVNEIICYEEPANEITLRCKHNKYINIVLDDYRKLNTRDLEQKGCESDYLESARKIRFNFCVLPYFPRNLFLKLKNVEEIEMNQVGLKRIDGEYFPVDSNLQILKMRYNNFTSIAPNLCVNARRISSVDFSYNQISAVDKKAFAGCEDSLEEILLVGNLITTITFEKLDQFCCLNYIDLELNKIVQLDCNSFPSTRTWEGAHIDFSYNELKNIDLNCDKSFKSLTLNIDHNNLENLTFPASEMMKNLRKISANKNQISSMSIQANLDNLNKLRLSKNNLEDISDINRCPALELLDISYNFIESIDASSFYGMSNLQFLDLKNNNISEIRRGAFSYQRNLTELDLSHNKLENISLALFVPYFENLTKFYLNDNNLTEIIGWDKALFPNLTTFAISENNFDCKYLEKFLKNLKSRTIYLPPSSSSKAYSSDVNSVYGIKCVEAENEVTAPIRTNEIRVEQKPTILSNDHGNQLVSLLDQILNKLENIKL